MKRVLFSAVAVAALMGASATGAQDPVKVDPKHYSVVFENDQVRVLHIHYGVGEKSVMHSHPDSVAVFLEDQKAKMTHPDGKSEEMTVTSLQRKRYLFVCINRRAEENPKGCCAAKDSEEVYRALKGEVAARGLAKLEARVCTSSCLDQCATGVTVLVEPDHFFYGRVTVADVPEIVDGLVRGQPVKRLVLTQID